MQESNVPPRSGRLEYIHALLGQLRELSAAERFDLLTYLIDMAFVEARDILRGERPARDEGNGESG